MIDITETLAARGLKIVRWEPAIKRDQNRGRDVAEPDLFLDGQRHPFIPIEVIGISRSEVEEGFLEAFDRRWPLAKGTVWWRQPDKITHVFPKVSESPPGKWHAYGLCVVI